MQGDPAPAKRPGLVRWSRRFLKPRAALRDRRLLGDRLLGHVEPLSPATRAYTYRQKAQRAFAAELLCPYEAVCDFLGNDRSEERCHDAASHFNVSSLTVSTVLLNNERFEQNWSAAW